MEVYILDNQFRRDSVTDRFESLIWSERFFEKGDCQLTVESTSANRNLFLPDSYLAMNLSNRVMKIDSLEDVSDNQGRSLLKIGGSSLESIFEDRIVINPALKAWSSAEDFNAVWPIKKTPQAALNEIFQAICVNNVRNPSDNLTNYDTGSFYPNDTNPKPTSSLQFEFPQTNLYDILVEICQIYNLGFRFVRHPVTSLLYFNIYSGRDRTSTQTVDTPIIFSQNLENLLDSSHLRKTEDVKNVAYVYNKKNFMEVVYPPNGNTSIKGFERKVLYVDATDIDLEVSDSTYMNVVRQRGQEELAKHRNVELLDGQLPENINYVYGRDYNLGDLVELRSVDGLTNRMRVTEQIFVDDADGERAYPTLTVEDLVVPGTWQDWRFNIPWDDAVGTWSELD